MSNGLLGDLLVHRSDVRTIPLTRPPLTYEEAEMGKVPDIRSMRDVVDLDYTRGCEDLTWRDKRAPKGGGNPPQEMEASDAACSMNLFQDYYGGKDLQYDVIEKDTKEFLNLAGDATRASKGGPNFRPSDASFELDSNDYRRGGSVAHAKSEYFVTGCIGGGANKGKRLNDKDQTAAGFMDYTNIRPLIDGTGEMCRSRSGQCKGADGYCIFIGSGEEGCKSGLHDEASHSIGNLYFGGTDSGPSDTYYRNTSLYCDRGDDIMHGNPQVARQYVRNEYLGDKSGNADPDPETRRACCLGAGTFQQGKIGERPEHDGEGRGYAAKKGKRPLGAPCKVDDDCWDGQNNGTVFCHNTEVKFYEGSEEHMPNREDQKLDVLTHKATFTCKRRCGPAGHSRMVDGREIPHTGNMGKFDGVDYAYGTTWIGSSLGDPKSIDDARERAVWGQAGWLAGPVGALIGMGVAEAINEGYIGANEKNMQGYLDGSNDNAFECGFQQRLHDKPGEKLYYKPVYELATDHDDTVDKFMCLPSQREYEYRTVGSATCYGNEKESWGGGVCQEKCGYGYGLELGWENSDNPSWYKADGPYPDNKSEGYCDTDPNKEIKDSRKNMDECHGDGGNWIITDPGDSIDKSEYTDEFMYQCNERCLPDEYVSSAGYKCMHNCSRGPVVDINNGHIQYKANDDSLVQCPLGYDSNDSDDFWERWEKEQKTCRGHTTKDACLEKRQDRGKEDKTAKEACDSCKKLNKSTILKVSGVEMPCDDACSRYNTIPTMCEWDKDSESCDMSPLEEFDNIYPVHNDFLSNNKNPVTGRKGDGAQSIIFKDRRCHYLGYPDQCWSSTMQQDLYGYARKQEAMLKGEEYDDYEDNRQMDAWMGMSLEDRKCVDGWYESFPGVCAKKCENYYRTGLMKVDAYCVEDETVHDQQDCEELGFTWKDVEPGRTKYVDNMVGGIVGYGYSHVHCPDCAGLEKKEEMFGWVFTNTSQEVVDACLQRCNFQELHDCTSYTSEDTCQVPGKNCRWSQRHNVCYDMSYKIEHPDAWFGLVCTEKCGTDVNYGHHPPHFCFKEGDTDIFDTMKVQTKAQCREVGGEWKSSLDISVEFCPNKSKCVEHGTLNRCYQPCASDQKQGVFDFLCQDHCERHMQDNPDTDYKESDGGKCMTTNSGVADAKGSVTFRAAETTFFKCRDNDRMYLEMASCDEKCNADCVRVNGLEAVTLNRMTKAEFMAELNSELRNANKVGDAPTSFAFRCENIKEDSKTEVGGHNFFQSQSICDEVCSSECEQYIFQCNKNKNTYDTWKTCNASCGGGTCARVDPADPSIRTSQASHATSEKEKERVKVEEKGEKDREEHEKIMKEREAEFEKEQERRNEEAKETMKQYNEQAEKDKNDVQSRAKRAKDEQNAKHDKPKIPQGGVQITGFGCAANGDGPRRPWFRNRRRMRLQGPVCWEDAPKKSTKCTALDETPCQDAELLAANACQHGEVETRVRKSRLTTQCGRVIGEFEQRKTPHESFPEVWKDIQSKCLEFDQCRWEDESNGDNEEIIFGKCVPREDYEVRVGDRVIVGSGVEWKERWKTTQRNENKKYNFKGELMDEHVQAYNEVNDMAHLRYATVVAVEPFCDETDSTNLSVQGVPCRKRLSEEELKEQEEGPSDFWKEFVANLGSIGDANYFEKNFKKRDATYNYEAWMKNEPTYTVKYDDGIYANETFEDVPDDPFFTGSGRLKQCINAHYKEFKKDNCCSNDMGAHNDTMCIDTLEAQPDNQIPPWEGDSWKENIQSWHYDGVKCKMDCPPGTKWDWPSYYCNETCDSIIESTKDHCIEAGERLKIENPDEKNIFNLCRDQTWEGRDGSKHIVCREDGEGGCESIFQGEWKEGLIPGACYKQGPEVTKDRGPNYGLNGWVPVLLPWALATCERFHGPHNCNVTIIGVFEKCQSRYGPGWTEGVAPGLCYRVEPRDFSAASMGGSVPIAEWDPWQSKFDRAFIPKTHIKANYGPRTWMRSTYPKMRFKPSFFPVQRPRRSYFPRARMKPSGNGGGGFGVFMAAALGGGEPAYAVGKARNAWWWDKHLTSSPSSKACMQGCDDPMGQADITEAQCSINQSVCEMCCKGNGKKMRYSGGVDLLEQNRAIPDDLCGYCEGSPTQMNIFGERLDKEQCEERGYTWKDAVKGVWDEDNGQCTFPGAAEDDTLFGPRGCVTIKKSPEKSLYMMAKEKGGYNYPPLCRAYWSPGRPSLGGLVTPFICDATQNTYTSEEQCEAACSGKCSFVAGEKKGDPLSPQDRVAVQRWTNDCGEFFVGKQKTSEDGNEIGGWCMEWVEESRKIAHDGICMGLRMKEPEGKNIFFCQKSSANCVEKCNGVWHDNLKEIATDSLPKGVIFPPISGLGAVVGHTRNDKDTLLMPFSLPKGVKVGVDDEGKPVERQILLTIPDEGEEKVFQVADRSLEYDRREAATCTASGVAPVRTFENKTEEECKEECDAEDQCRAFNWSVTNRCTLYNKNYKREEDETQSNVCSVMKSNPHLAKNAMGQPIGYNVRLSPYEGDEGLKNELHLLDVRDDVDGVGIPISFEKNPGKARKLGIMGTANSYKMRRWQSSALLGGDICREWIMDRHGNGSEILGKDERSPLYKRICDDYKENCFADVENGEQSCSILNDAMDWCNTRVDSARANSKLEVQMRLDKEANFHTWTDGECSDPSIKSKVQCTETRRTEAERVSKGQNNARRLAQWQSQEMLEDIPRCLPDTFSAFDLPARACPRWAADGAQGKFCRDLADKYPLQYDQKIMEFCANTDNALLPACDCLKADVVASERRSTENDSIAYCSAAIGARKADNYNDRADFCKSQQMLRTGESALQGTLNNYKHVFYEKCQDTLDAPHILKPKIRLSETNNQTCKINADDPAYSSFCGVLQSGCKKQPPMKPMCVNVVSQTINNCIIGAGDGPCGVIDNVRQTNNCCASNHTGDYDCTEINIAKTRVKNKILLNPEAEAKRRTAPILPDSDGIYMCEGTSDLFTSISECVPKCDTDCKKAYSKNAGSSFATGVISDLSFAYDPAVEDPALTAAKKCTEMNAEEEGSCTGFLFTKPDSAGDWLQYTILAASPELTPKYGATAFTLA